MSDDTRDANQSLEGGRKEAKLTPRPFQLCSVLLCRGHSDSAQFAARAQRRASCSWPTLGYLCYLSPKPTAHLLRREGKLPLLIRRIQLPSYLLSLYLYSTYHYSTTLSPTLCLFLLAASAFPPSAARNQESHTQTPIQTHSRLPFRSAPGFPTPPDWLGFRRGGRSRDTLRYCQRNGPGNLHCLPSPRGRQTGVRMKGTPPGRVGEQQKANYY